MKEPSAPKRSTGYTQISISLPTDLLANVNQLAKKETRTRSNLIALILHRHLRSGLPLHQSQCVRLPYNGYEGPDDAC
jgi:metal-responsive CopG/Arc/MetJ family transcriptional regulator